MTWAQRAIWNRVRHEYHAPESLSGIRVVALPAAPLATVRAALAAMVEEHDIFRTIFRPTAGQDLEQVVEPAGPVPLSVVETAAADSEALRDLLLARKPEVGDPTSGEYLYRLVIQTHGGEACHVGMLISKFLIDAAGLDTLTDDLLARLGGASMTPRRDCWQPLDQALFETGPVGVARNARAVTYWRQHFTRSVREQELRTVARDREPCFRQGVLVCDAADLSLETLAARYGVSRSAALLAAFSLLLTELTGSDTAFLEVISSSQANPRVPAVGRYATNGPFLLTVAPGSVAQLLTASAAALLRAVRYTLYDPHAVDELHDEISADGHGRVLRCFFVNDVAGTRPSTAAPPRPPAFSWGVVAPAGDSRLHLTAIRSDGGFRFELFADNGFLTDAELERLLLDLVGVLGALSALDAGDPVPEPVRS
ncbi:hypothetical protein [Dactylosporangium sp. NPDC049140]|jgi:hypothetical protein|uniref:hypothetical protein n=1 Tax=Dactylosporangium sp. NPDC049140 TaxID=3155647 RepID=UPI0034078780